MNTLAKSITVVIFHLFLLQTKAQCPYKTDAISITINGQNTSTFDYTCADANALVVKVNGVQNPNALYKWHLPFRLKDKHLTPSSSRLDEFEGDEFFYEGKNIDSLNLENIPNRSMPSIHQLAQGLIWLLIDTGACQRSIDVRLSAKPSSLRLGSVLPIVSCTDSASFEPSIYDGVPPYNVTYATNLKGYFRYTANYISNNANNTFIAQGYGDDNITVTVKDSEGCVDSAKTRLTIYGYSEADTASFRQWLSRPVINGKSIKIEGSVETDANQPQHLIFIRTDLQQKEIYRLLELPTEKGKWSTVGTSITDLSENEVNNLQLFNNLIFYKNKANRLAFKAYSFDTDKINSKAHELSFVPTGSSYTISDVTSSIFRVLWVTPQGDLYQHAITYDTGKDSVAFLPELKEPFWLASGVSLKGTLTVEKGTLFYFKNGEGLFQFPFYGSKKEELISAFDFDPNQPTQVRLDGSQNIYYMFENEYHILEYDYVTKNYPARHSTEIGIATESFDIEKNTKRLHFAGKDGNLYQLVISPDFKTNPKISLAKSTALILNDSAQGNIKNAFAESPFYRKQDGSLMHLFYIQSPCTPTGIDEGEFISHSSTRLLKQLEVIVYPNPTTSEIVVSISTYSGQGNISIYHSDGSKILEKNYMFGTEKLDLSTFPSGLYLLKASTPSGENQVLKVVKK